MVRRVYRRLILPMLVLAILSSSIVSILVEIGLIGVMNAQEDFSSVKYWNDIGKKFKYGEMADSKGYIAPIDFKGKKPRLTSQFGPRDTGIKGASTFHKGIDLGYPKGTPVLAVKDGVVESKYNNGNAGHTITLTFDDDNKARYFHLSAFEVRSGRVKQGDVIGYVGNTGIGSGDHLHFEVIQDGKHKNPLTVILGAQYQGNRSPGEPVKDIEGNVMDEVYLSIVDENSGTGLTLYGDEGDVHLSYKLYRFTRKAVIKLNKVIGYIIVIGLLYLLLVLSLFIFSYSSHIPSVNSLLIRVTGGRLDVSEPGSVLNAFRLFIVIGIVFALVLTNAIPLIFNKILGTVYGSL